MTAELSFQKIKVLAIDNDRGSLYLLKTLLESMGCEVHYSDTVKEAIDRLKTDTYDICFTDINLPVANGLQLTEFIRSKISKDLPVVAVTASIAPENRHICFEAGMNGFLTKPVGYEALKAELERHFNVKKLKN